MRQKVYQIKQYINYLQRSKSRQGHGVHSPFVFDLIETVFNHIGQYYSFKRIEKVRIVLLKDKTIIKIEDFGAGSVQNKSNRREISDITKSALLDPEYAQLLFRLVNRFQSRNIIEIGTSLGITSAYLASVSKKSHLYTIEGSSDIYKIAKRNLNYLKIRNVELLQGSFDEQLPQVLNKIDSVDFAFIDGNHRYEATIRYFEMLLKKSTLSSVFVFDDIYWSEGMTKAWKEIISRPEVSVSIDLYRMGLIFFRKENTKENFTVRF